MIKQFLVASACTVLVVGLTHAGDGLSNADIQATFAGKTAIGTNKSGSVKTYHAEDGSVVSVAGDGGQRQGKWWLSKKRDALCIKWEDGKKRCRAIVSDGKGGFDKIHPKKGKSVAHYSSIVDGNQTQ